MCIIQLAYTYFSRVLFFFCKNIFDPSQAEYSYFSIILEYNIRKFKRVIFLFLDVCLFLSGWHWGNFGATLQVLIKKALIWSTCSNMRLMLFSVAFDQLCHSEKGKSWYGSVNTPIKIIFTKSHPRPTLKYSENFSNFRLDILTK